MGDTFRGFGEMLVKVAIFIAIMVIVGTAAIWLVTNWIDSEFGDGTATPLILIVAGIGGSLLIYVVVTFLNNMTHRSAGDDIVAIFSGMVDAMGQHNKNQAQLHREELRTKQIAMKDEADRRKSERSLGAWFAKRDAKKEEEERKREEREVAEQEAADGDWAWFQGEADDIQELR